MSRRFSCRPDTRRAECPPGPLRFAFVLFWVIAGLMGCRLERPDPAAQASAILHKHPSDFTDQLASLDALAAREVAFFDSTQAPRPLLAESLYVYAQRLQPAMRAAANDSERIERLNAFVFDSLRIEPLLDDTSLATSVPSLVLARRRGSCVGLTLLYLGLGRALDFPLAPVFLPGHIFVRHQESGAARNIETLRRGIARSDSFYRATFSLDKRPWYSLRANTSAPAAAPATPEKALAALVFNLANAHRMRGDLRNASSEYALVEEALPGFPEALGNQGVCLMAQGDRSGARKKFLAALAGDSLAEAARKNLALLDGASR